MGLIANRTHSAVSYTGDTGYLNLRQTLRTAVSAASGLAYFMTINIGTSNLNSDGALLYIALDTYGFGVLNYPLNQGQTKVYISGRLDSDDVTALVLLSQSLSSDAGGMMTIDDVSFITYQQAVGVNPIPIPPVVSNATYSYVNMATQEYTIPQLEYRQTFSLTANAQIVLADSTTTCWLAVNFFPYSQQVVYQNFVANGTIAISAQGYLYGVTTSFDLEFNCQGVSGSVLTVSAFYLRAF